MKRAAKLLFSMIAFLSLLLGATHHLRVRSARGMALRSVKAFSEGLAPFLALTGAISAILSQWMGAPLAALAGAVGALLQASYVGRVMWGHKHVEAAFGAGWQERIRPSQKQRWLRHRWTWRLPIPTAAPRWQRDLVYHTFTHPLDAGEPGEQEPTAITDEKTLLCDLWQPPLDVPPSGLAIIYIHGGGFFTSRKDFGTRAFFRHLAAQGHVVMDIDYRLAPEADLFEMIGDVRHAIAWMKTNAEWLGADPRRIVLAGASAGAHLALLAAYTPNHPRLIPLELQDSDLSVQAVISYYGVPDLAALYRHLQAFMTRAPGARRLPENLLDRPLAGKFTELAAWVRGVDSASMREYLRENQALMYAGLEYSMKSLVGGSPEEIPEVYRLVSPLTYAGPGCPPTLLLQGEHDHMLPIESVHALHRRLRESNVPSVLVELPQTGHTFDLFLPELSPPAQSALYDVERFLALVNKD